VAQHSGLQPGESVAPVDSADRHRRLVADQFAAAGGEDRRSAGEACAVLLADAGRGTFDENTVLGDVAQNRVVASSCKLNDWLQTRRIEPLRTKEEGEVSEKSARDDFDNVGETRTARNRSGFRLQMQLWPCDSTRERYNSDKSVPKKEIPVQTSVRVSRS